MTANVLNHHVCQKCGRKIRFKLAPVEFTPVRDSKTLGSITAKYRDSRTDLDPKSVLFHEYAHHFMLHHFPAAYPAWYVEGFAEFFSVVAFPQDGSIEYGKIADMLLLSADPTADVNNIKQLVWVMKGGQLVDEDKLPLAGGPRPLRRPER